MQFMLLWVLKFTNKEMLNMKLKCQCPRKKQVLKTNQEFQESRIRREAMK